MKKESTLRELRELKNISQSKMLVGLDRSQYSRIETGATDLKIKTLETICNRLGISLMEYIALDNSNNKIEQLVLEFRACTRHKDDFELKEHFLEKFFQLYNQPKIDLTLIEYNFTLSVRSILSVYWKEIPALLENEKKEIFDYLITANFYGQYDYMLAVNTLKHFDINQIEQIIDKMYPLDMLERRNELTKQYSHLLLTNAITAFIYDQKYKVALKYVKKAQSLIEIKDSYYLHLTLLYLKNLSLSFIENQTKYIEKTRAVIRIIHDIGDITTANQLEKELDTLHQFPDYYKKTNQIEEMPASI